MTSGLAFRKLRCDNTPLHRNDFMSSCRGAHDDCCTQRTQIPFRRALFGLIRRGVGAIPDALLSDPAIAFTAALMSAFAPCFLKSPSLLAFDKERAEGNLATIDGLERVPCDTHMCAICDPVSPASRRPVFKSGLRQVQRGKALEALALLDGHDLWALDGTGYFSSKTIHCMAGLRKGHRNGTATYYQMLGTALIHPDVCEVMPLMPEPIMWMGTADSLRSTAPHLTVWSASQA
jgi:hypothetical protein